MIPEPLPTDRTLDLVAMWAVCEAADKARPEPWWVVPAKDQHDVSGVDYGDPNDGRDAYDLLEDPPVEVLNLLVAARHGWPATLRLLAEARREIERLKQAIGSGCHEIEQTLGKALGYPTYASDPVNFPDATESDGVCVGDHVPQTLATEAAQRIAELEASDREWTRLARAVDDAEQETQESVIAHRALRDKALGAGWTECPKPVVLFAVERAEKAEAKMAVQSARIAELEAERDALKAETEQLRSRLDY